jgi:hypothetical protein
VVDSGISEYCRAIETYLCRKNDGHLMRVVGPSFELVSRWAAEGIPLKVAFGGIDRYFERYYRTGPRRRPVKIDFCEADVLDVFDEWRRATGVTTSAGSSAAGEAATGRRKGPSLPEHIERVLLRLTNLRATAVLGADADALIDRVSIELDRAKRGGGLRGDARQAAIERLAAIDAALVSLARAAMSAGGLESLEREAAADLSPYRSTMTPEAYAQAFDRTTTRLVRERIGLPVVSYS